MALSPGTQRAAMAAGLRLAGISDPRVLAAMAVVPRERFVPPSLAARAYASATTRWPSTRSWLVCGSRDVGPAALGPDPTGCWATRPCPAVLIRARGRHRSSASRCTLVPSPPRERPRPSRSTTIGRVDGFLSFDPAPCGVRGRLRALREHREQPLGGDVGGWIVARAGRVGVGPDHGGVHRPHPLRVAHIVGAAPQPVEDLLPRAVR